MQNNALNIPSFCQNSKVLLEHIVKGCCWNFVFSNRVQYIVYGSEKCSLIKAEFKISGIGRTIFLQA